MSIKAFIKIPLILLENIIFSIFPNFRPIIEKYIYNPYQFNEKHINYSKKQFDFFINKVGGTEKIKGKTILELGPGGSLGFGLLALQHGASQYLAIEGGRHTFISKKQLLFYKELLGNDEIALNNFLVSENGKISYNPNFINFIETDQRSSYDLESDSVDLIYSCAVLEHVHDLGLCFSEMTRILKPGGTMNHQVDLRDHIFSQDSLWFLKISNFWFKFLFGKTGEYINRKRWSFYKKLISENKLEIIEENKVINQNKINNLRLLSKYSEENLEVSSFYILLKKLA